MRCVNGFGGGGGGGSRPPLIPIIDVSATFVSRLPPIQRHRSTGVVV